MLSRDLHKHFVFKRVRIRSYYGPYFLWFRLNTERFCKSSWLRHFKKNSSVRLTSKKCLFPLRGGWICFSKWAGRYSKIRFDCLSNYIYVHSHDLAPFFFALFFLTISVIRRRRDIKIPLRLSAAVRKSSI